MASCSYTSSDDVQKYPVFISFGGVDTRVSFTSHLDAALKRKGIKAYVDYQLKKGEKIETLFTVIEESTIWIIILSTNYASSSWCLEELSKILECNKTNGRPDDKVVPIFYHVDPSDVRHIRRSFKEALEKHQDGFKVERWRAALVEVGGIVGHHLPGHPKDRLESEVVEEIAQDISNKLMGESFVYPKGLVGIDLHVEKIESMLCFYSKDVRIVGIWGMGGIGKTTIAETVYNKCKYSFAGYCFVDVRKEQNYRRRLFSEILGDKDVGVRTNSLEASIISRLKSKKVFFVLDNVYDSEQLDFLSLKFGSGSRIIITSRDKHKLDTLGVHETYEVRGLRDAEALELFTLRALKPNQPKEDFVKLSEEVVHYVKGVPLALIVFGSFLCGKPLESWKGDLEKLKNNGIDDNLKISYDLLDPESKNIFLDIACFFDWEQIDYVKDLLNGCYKSAMSGIEDLILKSLLTISNGKIKMHILLRQMALNIIQQESAEPGERSRLWTHEDICHVLKNNTGTGSVKGMLLDMSKISRKVYIRPTAFKQMYQLNFLKFYYSVPERERKVFLEEGLESLPCSPSYLRWDNYPSKYFPSNFCPEKLVELSMCNSHVEQLWDGVQNLVKLKRLYLSCSQHLKKIPDLSRATELEIIDLGFCKKIEESWFYLENSTKHGYALVWSSLTELNLRGNDFETIPACIEQLLRLHTLDLSHCKRLQSLPQELPYLLQLHTLYLSYCERLQSLPPKLLPRLRCLVADHCKSLEAVSSAFPISRHKYQRFMFTNCPKLDQNCIDWVKTPLSIQQRATEDVKLYHEKVKLDHKVEHSLLFYRVKSSLSICYPGSEIPKWFSCQSQGSSVTIQLLPHLHDDKFVGLAVCFVLAVKSWNNTSWLHGGTRVSCKCNFNTNGTTVSRTIDYFLSTVDSDHVLLGYDLKFYCDWYEEESKHHLIDAEAPASFKFSVHNLNCNDLSHYYVKECGGHLLYAQDDSTVFPH